jgi:prevent-host-death family protein
MKTPSITEAKNSFSTLIDRLKAGSSVLIVDRGRPVGRLEPVTGNPYEDSDGRLSRLPRDGLIRPRRNQLPSTLFSRPPSVAAGRSAVEALIQERQDGP